MADPIRRRILLIDDDRAIRKAYARVLGEFYEVVEHSRGEETLAALEGGERFDAILCDLMMPELTGMEVFERIGRIAPDQTERVIFMTGGACTQGAGDFIPRVQTPCLEKPIALATLRSVVAAVASGSHRVRAGVGSEEGSGAEPPAVTSIGANAFVRSPS